MREQSDFSDIGDWIRDVVEEAVGTRDFSALNQKIENTVNSALSEAREQMKRNANLREEQARREKQRWESNREMRRQAQVRERESFYRTHPERVHTGKTTAGWKKKEYPALNESTRIPGILLTVFGSIGIGVSAVVVFALGLAFLLGVKTLGTSVLFFLALGIGFGIMTASGSRIRNRLKRAKRYLELCQERTYCNVKELADKTGQSEKYVLRDLRTMIRLQILKKGYLDQEGTCLMLDDEVYRQYQKARESYEKRRAQNRWRPFRKKQYGEPAGRQTDPESTRTEGAKTVSGAEGDQAFLQLLEEGSRVMAELRRLNDAIPGEAVSRQLDELDFILQKIFDVVRQQPGQQPQLRRFMEYYLPTTVRLVTAYADFDRVGIEGENITSAKREIEKTLETIYEAFKNLLDDLYQNAAMEAAADAQVLKTMLAQDGYMENEFKQG